MTSKKQGKTHVTPSKTSTSEKADAILGQMRIEQAAKDLLKSNKQKGIIAPKSLSVSTSEKALPSSSTTTAKSKKK